MSKKVRVGIIGSQFISTIHAESLKRAADAEVMAVASPTAGNAANFAKKYGIPILRNVPLAQALNKLEVGEDVPEELYEAVAEILAFVYKLTEEQKQKK